MGLVPTCWTFLVTCQSFVAACQSEFLLQFVGTLLQPILELYMFCERYSRFVSVVTSVKLFKFFFVSPNSVASHKNFSATH